MQFRWCNSYKAGYISVDFQLLFVILSIVNKEQKNK